MENVLSKKRGNGAIETKRQKGTEDEIREFFLGILAT